MDQQDVTESAPAPRLPLQMEVRYRKSYARQPEQGTLKNISMTGAFIETDTSQIGPEDKLVINLVVSGRRRKMTATVIWKNSLGCGILFQPFNNRDVQLVDDLIYFVENHRESKKGVLDDIFKRVS